VPEEELIEVIAKSNNAYVERIISTGKITPVEEWYDQKTDEWVVLLQGTARLCYDNGEEITLNAGHHVFLAAHVKHRVTYTSSEPPCLWLAVHIEPTPDMLPQLATSPVLSQEKKNADSKAESEPKLVFSSVDSADFAGMLLPQAALIGRYAGGEDLVISSPLWLREVHVQSTKACIASDTFKKRVCALVAESFPQYSQLVNLWDPRASMLLQHARLDLLRQGERELRSERAQSVQCDHVWLALSRRNCWLRSCVWLLPQPVSSAGCAGVIWRTIR
jgi:cupin 2 domain-containing protein